jgi:peptidyl-prolyl cis-trans isomerase D
MLQALRSSAAGWVAKIFLGLLVLSFAVWGIEDIFRIARGVENAAVVGERQISVEEFRNAYTNELRRISNQAKRMITPEQARMAGIGQKVLGDLVNEAAIDAKVAELGLSISDEEVAREIQDDEMFAGPNGQFNRSAFQDILRQNNLNENQYVALQRAFSVRKQLTDALTANIEVPDAFRRAIHAYNSDSRSITYVELAPEAPAAVPAPGAETLKAFFEERKDSFAAPEYRKLAVLALDPEAIAGSIQIPEEELRAYFDANQPKYADLEKRSIEQITFPTIEEAREARQKIKDGALFEQIMIQRKMKPEDAFLGDLSKSQIFDPKIADAAFALEKGQISEAIEGEYSNAILRVTGVQQQMVKSYEDVKDEIRAVLAQERARQNVLSIHDKIDEARLGGATLDEVAKANGLQVREVPAVDREGKGPDGKEVADLPLRTKLLEAAFRTEVGGESETLSEGDAYVWYEVRGVTPPRPRTFEEARALVEARWREEEAEKRLDARAAAALAELKGGKPFEQVAAAQKVEVQQSEATRMGGAPSITPAQAQAVFQTPVDGFGQTAPDDKGARLVFEVTSANDRPFDPSKPDDSGQVENIAKSMASDMVTALVRQLRSTLGTTFNPAAIAQVTGGGAG